MKVLKFWHDLPSANQINVCVITPPSIGKSAQLDLSNFIKILQPLSDEIFVITGDAPKNKFGAKIHVMNVKPHHGENNLLVRLFHHTLTQLRISKALIKVSKSIDVVIFHSGGQNLVLPTLLARLLGKKISVSIMGSTSESVRHSSGLLPNFMAKTARMLEYFCCTFAHQVMVESESVVRFSKLERYGRKIAVNGAIYIDTDNFKIKKDLKDRRNLIGYIGRLAPVKGVTKFAKAIPLILKERNDLEFLIGGDGPQFEEIRNELENNGSCDKVELTSWISHDELQNYLNELKLIILPSYTEGLPGIVLEAMACGTVVLATPVGGVPDLIKDGETGFIMENNSPECIAKNVIRALEHPNLEDIVKNARKLIEDEYSYEAMVRKCKIALDKLMERKS